MVSHGFLTFFPSLSSSVPSFAWLQSDLVSKEYERREFDLFVHSSINRTILRCRRGRSAELEATSRQRLSGGAQPVVQLKAVSALDLLLVQRADDLTALQLETLEPIGGRLALRSVPEKHPPRSSSGRRFFFKVEPHVELKLRNVQAFCLNEDPPDDGDPFAVEAAVAIRKKIRRIRVSPLDLLHHKRPVHSDRKQNHLLFFLLCVSTSGAARASRRWPNFRRRRRPMRWPWTASTCATRPAATIGCSTSSPVTCSSSSAATRPTSQRSFVASPRCEAALERAVTPTDGRVTIADDTGRVPRHRSRSAGRLRVDALRRNLRAAAHRFRRRPRHLHGPARALHPGGRARRRSGDSGTSHLENST